MHKGVLSIFISENKVFIVSILGALTVKDQTNGYILPSGGRLCELQQVVLAAIVFIFSPKIKVMTADAIRHRFRLYYRYFITSDHCRPHIAMYKFNFLILG